MSKKQNAPQPAEDAPQPTALDRFLALGALGIVALSIVCFLAIILGTWFGDMNEESFKQGFWPVVSAIPLYGLPIAFVMLVVVLFRGFARNAKSRKTK